MADLREHVAVVTGASRGIGRGIAVALGGAGATVVVTGRTEADETARLADAAGGRGIAVPCDHADDAAVANVFESVVEGLGRLDILVNNATSLPPLDALFSETPFWEVPTPVWDGLHTIGLRSHFIAAQHAARLMTRQRRGLIVNISSAGAATKIAVVPYGVAKAALDHMTKEMAEDLREHGVAVISLWPPPTRTESMLEAARSDATADTRRWSSPEFTGRVVAALACEPNPMARSGTVVRARAVASELGVVDDVELPA